MELLDRIEKRRFVGREFLLFLWFESEVFEGTLSTAAHGSFGLWIEKQLVLSEGKEETRIKGAYPGGAREAKESLRRGKLPAVAGVRVAMGDREHAFTLKAEQMALAGLRLPTVLDKEEETPAIEAIAPPRRPRKKAEAPADEAHEAFYERMHLTRDLEAVLEALYRDFLALRLGEGWERAVAPAMRSWVEGRPLDADRYRADRRRHLPATARRRTA